MNSYSRTAVVDRPVGVLRNATAGAVIVPYEDNMTIVQVITLAGGFAAHADKNNASVARLVKGQEQRFKVPVVDIGQGRAPNFDVRPGDIVFIPESLF